MLGILGLLAAFVGSIAEAGFRVVNQQYKIDPPVLAIYRGLGVALILLPFLIFIPYPTSPLFYLLVGINGCIASISSRRSMDLINHHGANIASKLLTVPPVLVAILWWVLQPAKFATFVDKEPYQAVAAIFCLIGMIFTIFALGHNKNTHKAVVAGIPIFICYVIQTFLCFGALKEVSLLQGMFYYVCLQGIIIGTINYFIHVHHLKGHLKEDLLLTIFDKRTLKAGLLFITAMIIARFLVNISFKLLPNPSWVVLICNLQIIWIYLASKKLHVKNVISPTKGIILAIYAITFIILTY
jgi:hypothetical protein